MRVRKNAWHVRWIRYLDRQLGGSYPTYVPKDLCSHFWTVVGKTITASTVAVLFGAFLAVAAVTSPIWASIWGIGEWNKRRKRKKAFKNDTKPDIKHEPGLLASWLSAKKRKVCPLIELVPDETHPASP